LNKNKKSVLVVGASGRMGQSLGKILKKYNLEPSIGVSRQAKLTGYKKCINKIESSAFKKSRHHN
jgi:dihydrodipicolinate reductase